MLDKTTDNTVKRIALEAIDFLAEKCKSDTVTISTVLAIIVATVVLTISPLRRAEYEKLFEKAVNALVADMEKYDTESNKDVF